MIKKQRQEVIVGWQVVWLSDDNKSDGGFVIGKKSVKTHSKSVHGFENNKKYY